MAEDMVDRYPQRRDHHHHHQYAYVNGTGGASVRDSAEVIDDDGAVRISHRISGINFTPTLHDSLVNEIRKLKNKLDRRDVELKQINEEFGTLHKNIAS
jgi:hypothetical protein